MVARRIRRQPLQRRYSAAQARGMDELLKRLDRADRVIKKIAKIVAEPQDCLDKNCEYVPAVVQLETLLRRYEADDPLEDLN